MTRSSDPPPDAADRQAPEDERPHWAVTLFEVGLALRPVAPFVIAAFVFVGGLVLLFSVSGAEDTGRMAALRDVLPLPFAEASHLSASLAGLALVVLSRGLALRMQQARIAATAVLIAGAVFALAKGLDWEPAGLLLALALALTLFRQEFYRKGDWKSFRPTPGWVALVAVTVAAVTAIGLLGYRNVAIRSELWWNFAWSGDAPRFLRASVALAVAVVTLALDALINRPVPAHRARGEPIPDVVRALVAASPQAARHLALLGDKRFLVSDAGDAFLMYAVEGRSWICLGGPVGGPDGSEEVVWRLAERAHRAGGRPVFCAILADRLTQLLDLGHAIVKMGEVARVDLAGFSLAGPARKDLRYAKSRAARDGLIFGVLPKAEVPRHIADLRAVSDAWLTTRKGREKGFALGYFDPAYLAEFDIAVMRRDGRIVAFANIWRGAGRDEIAVDLMRHLPGVSPVLMEAFFTALMEHAAAEGYRWFNLGGVPLSGLPDHPRAPVWSRIGTLIYRRGDDFYSFGGLRAFKQKFGPVWVPQYLTCPGGLSIPRALIDIAVLTSRPPTAAPVPRATADSA